MTTRGVTRAGLGSEGASKGFASQGFPSRLVFRRRSVELVASRSAGDSAFVSARKPGTLESLLWRKRRRVLGGVPLRHLRRPLLVPQIDAASVGATELAGFLGNPDSQVVFRESLEVFWDGKSWLASLPSGLIEADPEVLYILSQARASTLAELGDSTKISFEQLKDLLVKGVLVDASRARDTPLDALRFTDSFAPHRRSYLSRKQAEIAEAKSSGRVPVVAPYGYSHWSPNLALYQLVSHLRSQPTLAQRYSFVSPILCSPTEFLSLMQEVGGLDTAVLMLSHYLWTSENRQFARDFKRHSNKSVAIWGGPSVPKFEGDLAEFFRVHGGECDIAVHGEGESTLVELFDELFGGLCGGLADSSDGSFLGSVNLQAVAGISYRDAKEIKTTAVRDRISDLSTLTSPYLDGTYDLPGGSAAFAILETSRGCPYACSFCDWGSATASRLRFFPVERVSAEIRYLAESKSAGVTIADSNFGIVERDVEVARQVIAAKRDFGFPRRVYLSLPKNTTRHIGTILDEFSEVGIEVPATIAIQSFDTATLEAVDRSNIGVEKYLELARRFRNEGRPVSTDILLGIPGQTKESFMRDLQACMDLALTPVISRTALLPPMNDPAQRRRFKIEVNPGGIVVTTSTLTRTEHHSMTVLARFFKLFENHNYGRYLLRFAEDELGRSSVELLANLAQRVDGDPDLMPEIADLLVLNEDVRDLIVNCDRVVEILREVATEIWGLPETSGLETVLKATRAVLRSQPRHPEIEIELEHDIVSWLRDRIDATSSIDPTLTWVPSPAVRRLGSYGPGKLRIWDPRGDGELAALDAAYEGPELASALRDAFTGARYLPPTSFVGVGVRRQMR